MDARDRLVVIERARTTLLAEELQSLLAAEGIEAFVDPYTTEETVAGEIYREFTGVDVTVRPEDEARARAAIEEHHRAGRLLDELVQHRILELPPPGDVERRIRHPRARHRRRRLKRRLWQVGANCARADQRG